MASDRPRRKIYNYRYTFGVDGKRRVQIPAKWRPDASEEEVEFTLVVWPYDSLGKCLRVVPPDQMDRLFEEIAAMSSSDSNAVSLRRYLGSNSDQVVLDKGGRICVPEDMAEQAGLEPGKEALLVGLIDQFEIWEPGRYGRVREKDEAVKDDALKLI